MNAAIVRRRLFLDAAVLAAAWALLGAPLLFSQAEQKPQPSASSDVAPDLPKYDVASIKPSTSSEPKMMFGMSPDGVSIENIPIQMVLRQAFNVEDDRIVGAPQWVKTRHYDIQAKVAPEDAPKLDKLKMDQRQSMLLPLLEERLNLKYHHETRELPMYSLVVAKGGPKLKVSDIPDPGANSKVPDSAPGKPGDPGANNRASTAPRGRRMMMGRGHLVGEGTGISTLAHLLSQQLGRTVVDKTGLTGNYDFTLNWTPDDAPPPKAGGADVGASHNDGGTDDAGPSLFTALQEQLGLKVESTKGMADVIVIDHIDQPSEN
jgi:uncharacterized protein (TIGR03435 family)